MPLWANLNEDAYRHGKCLPLGVNCILTLMFYNLQQCPAGCASVRLGGRYPRRIGCCLGCSRMRRPVKSMTGTCPACHVSVQR